MKVIELMMSLHPECVEESIYYKLALRIELVLKSRHTILKSRTAKRKNKKKIANEIKELFSYGNGNDNEKKNESDAHLLVNKCNDKGVVNVVSIDSAIVNENQIEGPLLVDKSRIKENPKDGKMKLLPFDIN